MFRVIVNQGLAVEYPLRTKTSTKGVPLFFKVKIQYGTDNFKTTLRQVELYIYYMCVQKRRVLFFYKLLSKNVLTTRGGGEFDVTFSLLFSSRRLFFSQQLSPPHKKTKRRHTPHVTFLFCVFFFFIHFISFLHTKSS